MKKIMNLFAMMLMALVANANVININSGTADALRKALNNAESGDVIVMEEGVYDESPSNYIMFSKNIVVKAAKGANVVIKPQVSFRVNAGAKAELIGVKIDASNLLKVNSWYDNLFEVNDATAGNQWIIKDCEIYNIPSKTMVRCASDKALDSLIIDNCYIHDNVQATLRMESATLKGLVLTNTTIANVANGGSFWCAPINIVSTASDAKIIVDHCTFYHNTTISSSYADVTVGKDGGTATSDVTISNCIFAQPESYDKGRAINLFFGGTVKNCLTFNYTNSTDGINGETIRTDCVVKDPLFKDAAHGDLRISEGSPVYGAGTDGSALGDPRWIPKMEYYMVGSMTKDALDLNYKMEKNPKDAAEYMYAMTLLAGDYFQVVKSDGMTINPANCYPSSTDKFEVTASGEYTIYFRPEGDGGEGWYKGYIKAQGADLGGWESAFADAEGKAETNSYITYDAAKKKVSIYVREEKKDKAGVQVTYKAGAMDADKCYRLAVKINADHDISGVTMKCQKEESGSTITVVELKVNLGADEAYFYDEVVKGFATLVLDFSAAHKGDVIEISDLNIGETDCPEPPTYYLAGSMTDWLISDAYKFAKNEAVDGEYVLKVDLKEGTSIKVVGISGENETWYPGGVGKAYVIDAAHAGENTIHFRPAGNAEWTAFGGYFYMDAKTGVEQVGAGMESEKIIRDGKLYIRQNGTIYNVIGQKIAQ